MTTNWLELVLQGEQDKWHSTGEACWIQMMYFLCFLFYESKVVNYNLCFWHFQWPFHAYGLYRSCKVIRELAMQFSLQTTLFPLCYTMRSIIGMFSFAFWVISTQKCEAYLVVDSQHECMPTNKYNVAHQYYVGMLNMPVHSCHTHHT